MAEQTITKRCSACKEIKPLSEFYKNRSQKDGHTRHCKICSNENSQKYRQTEKGKAARKRCYSSEKGKESNRRRGGKHRKTEKGKAYQERYKKRYRQTEKGKAVLRATQKRFCINHPNFTKAVNAVNNAIQAGKLPRPDTLLCHYCPKPAQQYHHHLGYKPEHLLDVVPVCVKCHNNHRVPSSSKSLKLIPINSKCSSEDN